MFASLPSQWPAVGALLTKMVTKPALFFTSAAFKWLWFVYLLTYVR